MLTPAKQYDAQIAIIIPALNEEDAIRPIIGRNSTGLARWIIVVDNGSSDQTAQVALAAGAHVVSEPRRGYGRACRTGSMEAQQLGAEILVFMDGDGSDNPLDLPRCSRPFNGRMADLVDWSTQQPTRRTRSDSTTGTHWATGW